MEVIKNDIWCWENQILGGNQTKYKLLLCTIHLKRVVTEYFFNKVVALK